VFRKGEIMCSGRVKSGVQEGLNQVFRKGEIRCSGKMKSGVQER
jgi:hypothetical protein